MDDPARTFVLLAGCGILYNQVVSYIQEQLPERHGITAWLVVGGVCIPLFGLLMLEGPKVFLTALVCFAASGSPMIIGSMHRYYHE